MQVEFELEIHITFHTITWKIWPCFRKCFQAISSKCVAQVILKFWVQILLCFRNEHWDILFCDLDLENDEVFFPKSLDLAHLKGFKLKFEYQWPSTEADPEPWSTSEKLLEQLFNPTWGGEGLVDSRPQNFYWLIELV